MREERQQMQQAIAALSAAGQQGTAPVPASGNDVLDGALGLAISATKGTSAEAAVALLVRCCNALAEHSRRGLRVTGTLLNILHAILEANPNMSDTIAVGQAAQQAQAMGVATISNAVPLGAGPSQLRRGAAPPAVVTGFCHRCGRQGHWKTQCYATTDVEWARGLGIGHCGHRRAGQLGTAASPGSSA